MTTLDAAVRSWPKAMVTLPSGIVIDAAIAADEEARTRGYACSAHPPVFGSGILFVFPRPGRVPFTMADTSFPLDLAFMIARSRTETEIDADIVHLVRGMPHHERLYESQLPYDMCLETTLYSIVKLPGDGTRVRIRRAAPR